MKTQARALLAATGLAVALTGAPTRAAIPVTDLGGIMAAVAQLEQMRRQVTQLRRQVEHVQNAARQLDPSSFRSVYRFLRANERLLTTSQRRLASVQETIAEADEWFREKYPDGPDTAQMSDGERRAVAAKLNQHKLDAALESYQVQTEISAARRNDEMATEILQQSEASNSEVAQMQAQTQMLAVVHSDLADTTQLLAAESSMKSNHMAAAETKKQLAKERDREFFNRTESTDVEIESELLE